LGNQYGQIMDHITVTEEMRSRILGNLYSAEVRPAGKVVRFPHWRRAAAIAACFAILLIGALTIPGMLHPGQENQPDAMQGNEGIVECRSAEELSQKIGFPVSDLTVLPFDVKSTAYFSSWGSIGEIDYTGTAGQTANYRKSAGTEDNSGIYDTFPETKQISVGTISATLKGDGSKYTLACWTDGTYAYSIVLSEGVDAEKWGAILGGAS